MLSTAIYLRVSTEEQAKEGYSIRAQEEKLRAYTMIKEWLLFDVYSDEGISGKDIDGRPEIKRLLDDVKSGKVNNVLVYKIDRLTRSTKNLIELVDLFNQHNCAFNSLNESIDTASATGRMFLKIVGIFAEFERENLAERVRMGVERKAREGYSVSNFSQSYGYNRENGNKIQEINHEEANIVKRIFSMYLHDDYNIRKITQTLNAENISSKMGRRWTDNTVKKVLENCNHIGKVRYGTKDPSKYFEVDGHHEPILDSNTFYQVQEKIKKMQRISRTKRPTSEVYFCGILYCPTCGGKYSSHWLYRKKKDNRGEMTAKHPNYRCINAYNLGSCTNRGHFSHKRLELAFADYIARVENLTEIGNTKAEPLLYDSSAEMTAINIEVEQIEKKTKEVMSFFMSGNINLNEYQGMVAVGNDRRGELMSRLAQLERAEKYQGVRFKKAEIVASFRTHWQALDNEQRQQFMQKFVKKLTVHAEHSDVAKYRNLIIIDDLQFNEF
ncbi:MAG: recombinase family protein [Defluviitaleaceae bacterium]|nr:recombinase family protein [Defluviitaleaceae bacterium]